MGIFAKLFGLDKTKTQPQPEKTEDNIPVKKPITYQVSDSSEDDGQGFIVKDVSINNVSIALKEDTVYFSGKIEEQNPADYMRPFFEKLHNKIINHKKSEIHMDVTSLDFMNSRGIKEFVVFNKQIDSLDEDKQFKVIIHYNANKPWQKASFTTISMFSPKHVSIIPVK